MAITINLYQSYKNVKSTALPSTAAVSFTDCLLREGCSVQRPVVGINGTGGAAWNPSGYNYAYINAFSRYYWVLDWTWDNGLWWCSMRVDVLATARGIIGLAELYVLRSSYSWDNYLIDRTYPATMQYTAKHLYAPRMWTCGPLPNYHDESDNSGCVIAGIASTAGIIYYVFTPGQFSQFLAYIFSDAYYTQVLGSLSVTMYPEAKIAVDPLQYIVSARFYPASFMSGDWAIYPGGHMAQIHIGTVLLPSTVEHTGYLSSTYVSRSTWTIAIDSSDIRHPEADERGDYLDAGPYTEYELFYPPFGIMPLNSADLANAEQMLMTLSVDPRTGLGAIDVRIVLDTTAGTAYEIAHTEATVGVDLPLSHVQVAGVNPLSLGMDLLQTAGNIAGNLLTGNVIGAASSVLGGASSMIQDAVQGQIPHLSKTGSVGSLAQMYGTPMLTIKHYRMADDDNNDNGRPLCQIRRISTIPGYIVCDPTGFACGLTEEETAEIHQHMREGFFYA